MQNICIIQVMWNYGDVLEELIFNIAQEEYYAVFSQETLHEFPH